MKDSSGTRYGTVKMVKSQLPPLKMTGEVQIFEMYHSFHEKKTSQVSIRRTFSSSGYESRHIERNSHWKMQSGLLYYKLYTSVLTIIRSSMVSRLSAVRGNHKF